MKQVWLDTDNSLPKFSDNSEEGFAVMRQLIHSPRKPGVKAFHRFNPRTEIIGHFL
jgi:hypothetical protein